jgi:hypothetical protein
VAAKRTTPVDNAVHAESAGAVPTVQSSEVTHEIKPVDGKLEFTVTSLMKVNYGDYEHQVTFAAVKGTYASEVDIDALAANLDEKVFSLMAPQLEAARGFSIKESFVRKLEIG